MNSKQLELLFKLRLDGLTWKAIAAHFPEHSPNALRKTYYRESRKETEQEQTAPKVLILDIETTPIISYTWGLFDQNVALNQIVEDWSILSWSAKWLDSDKIFYRDTRNEKTPREDKKLLQEIWNLIDEADIVCGQNSTRFDLKKLNARFIQNGMKPPSPYRQLDTLSIAKKHFAFTSNKLEYLSKTLCSSHKKSSHATFAGFELWKECLAGNKAAFAELERYNVSDILSTEELLIKLLPWDKTINFSVYNENIESKCTCGSKNFSTKGYVYTNTGKFRRHTCDKCGKHFIEKENLLSKEKRKSIRK